MTVNYRVWLKDRENPKSKMQFIVTKFFVDDIFFAREMTITMKRGFIYDNEKFSFYS